MEKRVLLPEQKGAIRFLVGCLGLRSLRRGDGDIFRRRTSRRDDDHDVRIVDHRDDFAVDCEIVYAVGSFDRGRIRKL